VKRWSLKSVRTRWSVHEVTCVLVPEKGSKKGFIPLGWALTLFQVKNSHVMEWWRKDSEKRAFCSNYIYTFRSFLCIKCWNYIQPYKHQVAGLNIWETSWPACIDVLPYISPPLLLHRPHLAADTTLYGSL
jgi:hypothetical protein